MYAIIGRAKQKLQMQTMHITGDKHLLSIGEQICGLLTEKGREDDYKILKENIVGKSCLNSLDWY